MKPPIISVVIATSGRLKLLQRTLKSLVSVNKPSNYGMTLVIENGPKAGAHEIVAQFAEQLNAKYLYSDYANKSHALNQALAIVPEQLLFFTDDDVQFSVEVLEKYSKAAANKRGGEFYGGPTGVDYERPPPEWLLEYLPRSAKGFQPNELVGPVNDRAFLGFNWAAFTSDIIRCGGFDPNYGPGSPTGSRGSETNLQQRLRRFGVQPIYVPAAKVWHYVPPERCSPQWVLERAWQTMIPVGIMEQYDGYKILGMPIRYMIEFIYLNIKYALMFAILPKQTRFRYRFKIQTLRGHIYGITLQDNSSSNNETTNNDLHALDNYKPKPNEDWQLHWLDDQPMLFSKSHDGLHLLNPVAGFIWTYCDGETDVKAIRKALQDVFVDNQDEVVNDLPNILTFWQKHGLMDVYQTDNFNYDNTVLLAGSARSGTTWISEVINYDNKYRFLFEPFNPRQVDIVKHFSERQYIRPNNQSVQFTKPIKAILSGYVYCKWANRGNDTPKTNKSLIKAIRAHLFLKWIKVHCPQIPIIFLMRHPCAVADSRMRLTGVKNHSLVEYLNQHELVKDFLEPFKDHIQNARTEFEKTIFSWCIENYIPLKQFQPGELYIIFYENFCIDLEGEIAKLFDFLGDDYCPKEVLKIAKRPSSLAAKHSAIVMGENLIENWKTRITDEQLERAIEILALFGLDHIYGKEALPLVNHSSKAFLP